MKKLIASALLLIIFNLSFSQDAPKWLRYPAISPDGQKIVFTYKGDLYSVPVSGGLANPLTFHQAQDFMPVWSNDGKTLTFASDRFGNFDVFTMPAEGGEAVRVTYHSGNEFPYSFSSDDKTIIFGGVRQDVVDHRQYPTGSQPEVYEVPVKGGRVSQYWTIPAEDIKLSKSGRYAIYHDKKGGENAWRKHHTSSITRDIWVYDNTTKEHKMLIPYKGEDRNPVFSADEKKVFYLSEEGGTFNVHSFNFENPQSKQQVTTFKLHPVRYLSASNEGTMSFSYDGELYTLKEGGAPQKIAITIRTQDKLNNTRIVPISGNVREMAISPNGKEVAYIVRGEIFVSSIEGSVTKRITNTAGQERFVSFSPDGDALIYAGERANGWQIYQTKKTRKEESYFYASTVLKEEPVIVNTNSNYLPRYSPDGKEIAFVENKTSLKILNLATKQVRTLLTPAELFYMSEGDKYFTWSPDSRWLLVEYAPVMANSEIVLIPADGKSKMINLTESGYGDFSPKWVGGKQMLWFSDRHGLRSYANSGDRQADVYSMFFTQEVWDRFNLKKDDYTLLKDKEEKEKEEKEKLEKEKSKEVKKKNAAAAKKDSITVTFDWSGLRDRKARLTIHSASLADAALTKDGEKLFYLAKFEEGYNLWSTELRDKKTKMELELNADNGSLSWDKDMKNLFLLADGKIYKINAESTKKDQVQINGELNLDLVAERNQMFEHVWSRTKGMFYISTFHGANWDLLKTEYAKYLPHIGTSYEFMEMLSELLGELNVSHAGARVIGSDPGGDNTASLGVIGDFSYTADGIRIAEVITGGPLDKAKFSAKPGMIIEQIDGELLSASRDIAHFLNRKADKLTLLQIFDPSTNSRHNVAVKPITLSEENRLLYKRWVRKNQEEVDRLSKGELGYIHIPGMSDEPYRNTYEEVMGKYHDRKGIIIDTRFNGGGDLVSDLAMFFTGKKFIDYSIESRSLGYEPGFRWTKPSVAMVNEANYSDGHCFACGYQELGIGKMIGMPVPGTCSFAGWEALQDGSIFWGAVPVSAKNSKGEWMENHETVPEIQIKNDPNIITKGRDQQLEKAVEELLKVVK
jgi:Tol biopolymer transport system component/C-terminal processing protease CtpA/Prc